VLAEHLWPNKNFHAPVPIKVPSSTNYREIEIGQAIRKMGMQIIGAPIMAIPATGMRTSSNHSRHLTCTSN
jgi:hypothetical protein